MAHFYASAQGSRGETHRLGGKRGATAAVRSWTEGIRIAAFYSEETKKNHYIIYLTGGSDTGGRDRRYLGEVQEDGTIILQGGKIIKPEK